MAGAFEYHFRESPAWSPPEDVRGPFDARAATTGTDWAAYTRQRPGMSAFAVEPGIVYHTYSAHARGPDGPCGMYQWLDRAPRGRNEARGVIPPGASIPLHSHEDTEEFFIVAGTQQVLTPGVRGLEWSDVYAGDYVHVPGGTPHAHRNVSPEPAIDLIVTTARLGRFFQEVGRPVTSPPQPPTSDEVARFVAISAKYGYMLGTPEENAAAGIEMPKVAGKE